MRWEALKQWGDDVTRIEPLTGGVANDVWSLRVNGRPAVGRLGVRSDADLVWETALLQYLDHEGLVERYRRLGKSYLTLVIRPIQNEGPKLKVAVVGYWVSYKKHRLALGLSDWSDVEFRYDCDQQQFVVSSVKLGGI